MGATLPKDIFYPQWIFAEGMSPQWNTLGCILLVRGMLLSSSTSHLKFLEEANGIENALFETELNTIVHVFKRSETNLIWKNGDNVIGD